MWHDTLAILAVFVHYVFAAQIWPSTIDEIEDLLFVQTGYRALGFASAVTPCSNSLAQGFRVAAGFVRTAFHDVAAFDAGTGTGGLDASIGFEMADPYSVHNSGPDFYAAMSYYNNFFNSKASMADLVALGTYASVRSCGGPSIAMRAGRIDATGPGPNSLPDVADSKEVLIGRFAKMGFSPQEMIQLVACGHTLGGVHPGVTSAFQPQDPNAAAAAAQKGVLPFDTTDAAFDNRVAKEYVDGTTQNPLVVGNPPQFRSDLRVFSSDNNVTIRTMTDPSVFQGTCQKVMQKMLERVPSNVQLSDVIQPYDVKPARLNFNVLPDGSLGFSGEVRIRTTLMNVQNVQLIYTDRSGNACDGCSISTTKAGDAQGFDESFSVYGFSAKVDSISSFKVVVNTAGGQVRIFDNGGNGFKVNDGAFVQVSSSSWSGQNLKVVVAVRSQAGLTTRQNAQPEIILSVKTDFQFNQLPTITKISGSVSNICGGTQWSFYTATFTIASAQANTAKLDVFLGGVLVDGFRSINFPSSGTTLVCVNAQSTTLSTSTTTTTSSTISSTTTSTSSSTTSNTLTSSTTTLSSTSSTTSSNTIISSSTTSTTSTATQSGTTSSLSSTDNTSSTSTTSSTSSSFSTTTSTSDSLVNSSTATSTDGFVLDPILATTSSSLGLSTSTMSTLVGSSSSSSALSGTSASTTSTSGFEQWSATSKASDTSKSTTSSVDLPAWTAWEIPSAGASIKTASASGAESGKSTSAGAAPYATPGFVEPIHEGAQAALASAYQSLANKPAPSGGTDGGNQNLEGLDLNIQVADMKPAPVVTGTTAVYTNTVVYVTKFTNAQESANVVGSGSEWLGWGSAQSTGGSKPTQGAGSQGTQGAQSVNGDSSEGAQGANGSGSGNKPAQGAGSSSASGSWSTWSSQASAGSTPTRTGLVAQYTGAADGVRTGTLAVGMAALFGAAVVML